MKKPIHASSVAARPGKSGYPEVFADQVAGRIKRRLGDAFGIANFGVNLTELAPGAVSALGHYHSHQDEFVFVLEGRPTLVVGDEQFRLQPGECYGFAAGDNIGHQLRNDTNEPARYLEIGDRIAGDSAEFPDDDIKAVLQSNGSWKFTRKDGTDY